jgi:pyrrolysine biosynthesis protein PylC
MGRAGPLHLHKDFYGADEAITNYSPGRSEWVATLIITGTDRMEAWEKRNRVIEEIRTHFKLDKYKDPFPPFPHH